MVCIGLGVLCLIAGASDSIPEGLDSTSASSQIVLAQAEAGLASENLLGNRAAAFSWWPRYRDVYSVSPGTAVRHIPVSLLGDGIPFRDWRGFDSRSVMISRWDHGTLVGQSVAASQTRHSTSFESLLFLAVGLTVSDVTFADGLNTVMVAGDWSVDKQSGVEDRLADIETILETQGLSLAFESERRLEPVIVVSGTPEFRQISEPPMKLGVYIYGDEIRGRQSGVSYGRHDVDSLVKFLESHLGVPLVDETDQAERGLFPSFYFMASARVGVSEVEEIELVLQNLSAQTGLEFNIEERYVVHWTVDYRQ